MSAPDVRDPVRALVALTRAFGPEAARAKREVLERLAERAHLPAARLVALQESLLFLLAHPDDVRVRAAALALVPRLREWVAALPSALRARLADTGLAGTATVDTFGYPLLERLRRACPGDLELNWDEGPDTSTLQQVASGLLLGAEAPGLDDITLEWDDWLAAARRDPAQRDLELLLDLFARAPLAPAEREQRFDGCALPVRWQHARVGSARVELVWPIASPSFRRRPPAPLAGSIPALVRRPLRARRLAAAAGERFLDFAACALAARQSEIRPLSSGNPRDVTLAECGDGLVVALCGVAPHAREALESLYTALLLQNGVPIAYGPAALSAGCCELGLNLFEEFRGFDTRRLYAQYMRALYGVLGARLFFVTAYGMGAGNPEALHAGSFWFYRRLGFRPESAAVERLARAEELRLARTPGARSDLATLRRFATSGVRLDLSRGTAEPLALGRIALAVTRRIAREHGGDRARALAHDAARVARALGLGRSVPRAALELVAPVLALDPELARRPRAERAHLARFVRAKGAASERDADAELRAAPGFLAVLAAWSQPNAQRNETGETRAV